MKPLILTAVLGLALAAAPAHAGTYVVVGCADPATHAVRPTDGWFLEQGVYPSGDECWAGRGLYATTGSRPNLFRFDAPRDTTIERLVLSYRAHLSAAKAWAVPTFVVEARHGGAWTYFGPARGYIGGVPIDFGGDGVAGDASGADSVRVGVRCELQGPCDEGGQPEARFRSLAVVVADDRPPAVAVAARGGHLQGTTELAVGARDEGGGVHARSVVVGGRVVADDVLCDSVAASVGPQRHFVRRVPCPLDASGAVALDTRALPDGEHRALVRAEDAAANVREADTSLLIDNLPPTPGAVRITGDPRPSEGLTAEVAGFGGQGVEYEYRWQRCGRECVDIGGAVHRTYAVNPRDVGHRLRSVVAATDHGGTVRVASDPVGPVAPEPSGATLGAARAGSPRIRLVAWLERGRRRMTATTTSFGTRVRIRGRLTNGDGRPLARTPVRMLEQVDGRRRRAITGVRTRRDGRFTTFTKVGPSRRFWLVHGDAAVTLRQRVRAAVWLHGRIGRVVGGHIPRGGVRVEIQVRRSGRWSRSGSVWTDGTGRFHLARRPRSAVRAVVPARPGYPYARGTSHPWPASATRAGVGWGDVSRRWPAADAPAGAGSNDVSRPWSASATRAGGGWSGARR